MVVEALDQQALLVFQRWVSEECFKYEKSDCHGLVYFLERHVRDERCKTGVFRTQNEDWSIAESLLALWLSQQNTRGEYTKYIHEEIRKKAEAFYYQRMWFRCVPDLKEREWRMACISLAQEIFNLRIY